MTNNFIDKAQWYAMRVTYGRELIVQQSLCERFKTYVPKCYKIVQHFGRRRYELTSAVSNLIFIYATVEELKTLKQYHVVGQYLRFIKPSTSDDFLFVPEKQMNDFIRVNELPEEKLIQVDLSEGQSLTGQKVRITEGDLAGVEGRILRIQGNKKVVVSLGNFLSVAIDFISPKCLVKI